MDQAIKQAQKLEVERERERLRNDMQVQHAREMAELHRRYPNVSKSLMQVELAYSSTTLS
jgi:hypothetical protein